MSGLIHTLLPFGSPTRKTPPAPQGHYASCQTSSHCHFGSVQGANSICDEVSDVLLGRVQRQCDRISYSWKFVAQYASLPAHGAFHVNCSMPPHSSSPEGNRLQRRLYRTMYMYSHFSNVLTWQLQLLGFWMLAWCEYHIIAVTIA